ncbi:MAG: hypothetical protein KDD90_10550 [Sphingomonadaceae bacterium]|jgi:uncharacterized membrane protein|nr:hypothetical protein [Sphingomonadaceae bacterium]
MSDDLTKPPNSGPPASGGFDANHPTIISLCYLGSFITGITGIVGIVLAYVWRDDAEEWERSHYTYLIRTFWIGLLASVLLTITLIGIMLLFLPAIWVGVRSVMSLVKAQKREPMPDPETWLF